MDRRRLRMLMIAGHGSCVFRRGLTRLLTLEGRLVVFIKMRFDSGRVMRGTPNCKFGLARNLFQLDF